MPGPTPTPPARALATSTPSARASSARRWSTSTPCTRVGPAPSPGTPADADDLVQETILKAYRAWDQYEQGTNAKGWLLTILPETPLLMNTGAACGTPKPWISMRSSRSRSSTRCRMTIPRGNSSTAIVDDQVLRAVDQLPESFP